MKPQLIALAALSLVCATAHAGNYTLTIDGQQYNVDLATPQQLKLPSGQSIQLTLEKNATSTFKANGYAFDHPSTLTPSQTSLSSNIQQTGLMSPLGTVIMIQTYNGLNPTGLVDLMLQELTKEEAQYGYTITNSPAQKKLAAGTLLKGKTSLSKYKDREYARSVLGFGGHDSGLLIMTQIEKEAPQEDREMIELFWKTLRISLD